MSLFSTGPRHRRGQGQQGTRLRREPERDARLLLRADARPHHPGPPRRWSTSPLRASGSSCRSSSCSTRSPTWRTRHRRALGQGREDLAREALSRRAAAQQQIDGLEAQHQELAEQEEKLEQTLGELQERVNNFRSQKEVIKAQYTAAQASASVNEEAAGISSGFGDSGAALARAQDKIANMQARAGAMDELMQSGVLEDVGGDTDDIQQELDEAGSAAEVDRSWPR